MTDTNQTEIAAPLPCRGCVATCPYRDRCEGNPWRVLPETGAKDAGGRRD